MWSELRNSPHTELKPPVPFTSRPLNTRTMKETFKSFVELLISVALDEDVMTALERANGKKKNPFTLCRSSSVEPAADLLTSSCNFQMSYCCHT